VPVVITSFLYAPGDRPERIVKAATSGASAVICDLEDAVAPSAKDQARRNVGELTATWPSSDEHGAEIWVRINSGERGLDDIAAVISIPGGATSGIVVPKASVAWLAQVDAALHEAEFASGRTPGSTPVNAIIETAAAVFDARAIAQCSRVRQLAIGEADLGAELGVDLTPGSEHEFLTARSLVVLASAAAGLVAPVGPVARDFRDLDGFRASTVMLRRLGFGARSAIHPAQVPIMNEVFTPTEEQWARAHRLVELYDRANANGLGAVTDDDGTMVDEAVVRRARLLVASTPSRN
jgi:citrate lyase subunit beta / citryl-CoA lyase